MRALLAQGFADLARAPRTLVGIQIGGGALWLAASAVYLAVSWRFGFVSSAGLVALMLLRQGLIYLRTSVRAATLSATVETVRGL
jgi:hypothetical protein